MADKVKVRILPFRGIGGVGMAGDVVTMERAQAEEYVRDGYVEVLADSDEQLAVSGELLAPQAGSSTVSDEQLAVSEEAPSQPPPNSESANLGEGHTIMKPEARRLNKVVRKK